VKKQFRWSNYRLINLIFAGIILSIFTYSFVFGRGSAYPIPSGSLILTGASSTSTGLSRSFSAITHFRFAEAHAFNPNGIRIFIFFFFQLFIRLGGFFMADQTGQRMQLAVFIDIFLSVLLFLITFWPFITSLGRV
jgi:hypothetical protein